MAGGQWPEAPPAEPGAEEILTPHISPRLCRGAGWTLAEWAISDAVGRICLGIRVLKGPDAFGLPAGDIVGSDAIDRFTC